MKIVSRVRNSARKAGGRPPASASWSEHFRNVCLGLAGAASAIVIPAVGLRVADNQNKRALAVQTLENTRSREASAAEAERSREASAAEAERARDAAAAEAERAREATKAEAERAAKAAEAENKRARDAADAEKEKEIAHNFVELGIRILSEKSTSTDNPVRAWAIDLVNHYSSVKLPDQAKDALESESFFEPISVPKQVFDDLPSRGYIRGIGYNPRFRWDVDIVEMSKKYSFSFDYLKISDGVANRTPNSISEAERGRSLGLKVGGFHVFQPKDDPKRQADFYISVYKSAQWDLPPMVDCEPLGGIDGKYADNVFTFLKRVESQTGQVPVIYATRNLADERLDARFGEFPLFLADPHDTGSDPRPAKWWKKVTFWHLGDGIGDNRQTIQYFIFAFKGTEGDLKDLSKPAGPSNSSPR